MMLLTLAAAVVAAGETFTCTPTAGWDGDGPIWCAEGPHVRISGIVPREMDGTCRENQPCPSATALRARDALIGLFGDARAPTALVTSGLPGQPWSAALKAPPEAVAPPPGAPCPPARTSPARWSQPAPCSNGTATGGAIGVAEPLGALGLRQHGAQDPRRQGSASCCRTDRCARSQRR